IGQKFLEELAQRRLYLFRRAAEPLQKRGPELAVVRMPERKRLGLVAQPVQLRVYVCGTRYACLHPLGMLVPVGCEYGNGRHYGDLPAASVNDQPQAHFSAGVAAALVQVESRAHGLLNVCASSYLCKPSC